MEQHQTATFKDGILRLFFLKKRDRVLSDATRYKAYDYLKNNNKSDQSIKLLNQSLLFDPYNPESYVTRGSYHLTNNVLRKALFFYSFAIVLDKKCLSAYVNRAGILIKLYRYKMALSDIEIAMSLGGYKEPPLYYTQGVCFMRLGDYHKALLCFHDAEILGFKDTILYKQKGLVLEKLNDKKESYRYLKKAYDTSRSKEDKQCIKTVMKRVSPSDKSHSFKGNRHIRIH